jgi:hypothetical protein
VCGAPGRMSYIHGQGSGCFAGEDCKLNQSTTPVCRLK